MIAILFALSLGREPLPDYAGPPWPIERGAPSFGLPIHTIEKSHLRREPVRFKGYKWFRNGANWDLYRMLDAPHSDIPVLLHLGLSADDIWQAGRR